MQDIPKALTFDDVLLKPAYSEVLPAQTNLQTTLARDIQLAIPLLSSAMDTVTEANLAIALAQEGGLGVIHKNMPIESQAREVREVKKYESGVIHDPCTVSPGARIAEVLELMQEHGISGVPVVDPEGRPAGIVTRRDLRFEVRREQPVASVMTPRERLVTVLDGTSSEEVQRLLHKHRIEKVLVVNRDGQLSGLITVKDIQKAMEYPHASKDDTEQLRTGAAVGVNEESRSRAEALVEARVDVLVVDTAHGHSRPVLEMVRWLRKRFPGTPVIGGNIATKEGALALAEAGVDAVKVGIGPGSICTTRVVTGIGVPQVTAVTEVAQALAGRPTRIISDGGIRYSGDIAKAIACGAHSVMIGSLFAGTEEAPGEMELYQGRYYKSYRGMGSLGAMAGLHGSSDRYFQDNDGSTKLVPEGVEGRVQYKGALKLLLQQLTGGLRSSMGYTGCRTLEELRTRSELVRLTTAGLREGHVHDVDIIREPPNYHRE